MRNSGLADLIGNDVARVCDVNPHTQDIAWPDRAGIDLQILVLEACVAARVRAQWRSKCSSSVTAQT